MKKLLIAALAAAGILSSHAQQDAYYIPKVDHNLSIGLDGGVTTTLARHHQFFGDMRGMIGMHFQKQISPGFALGVEGAWGINTSSWFGVRRPTVFDNSYVGVYGGFNLFNIIGGFRQRLFDMELVLGAGWGHDYTYGGPNADGDEDYNYAEAKLGLNFNFNLNRHITLSLKPAIAGNLSGSIYGGSREAFARNNLMFNCLAGFTYHFDPGFVKAERANPDEVNTLNTRINDLRTQIDSYKASTAANQARTAALAAELEACNNRKPEKVAETNGFICNILYRFDSDRIYTDQQPYMESVAKYLKDNPQAKVTVRGYASPEGSEAYNVKLAQSRAESVKNMLVNRYGISADRISAQGDGISHVSDKRSWNRVSICTVQN